MKKLSIIIPTLNSHGVVKSQIIRLQNILSSYQNDVDVIIVDDGSNPSLVESLIETNFPFTKSGKTQENLDVWKLDNIFIIETKNYNKWTQAIACNIGVRFANSEYVYNTAIDHFITLENIKEVLNFNGDCLKFPRSYGVILDNGEISTDVKLMEKWGYDGSNVDVAWDIYSMKKDLFLSINGYNEEIFGSYWGVDIDFFGRYSNIGGDVYIAFNTIYVFPEPDKNVEVFHNLSRD
jgi:hypothetical protein